MAADEEAVPGQKMCVCVCMSVWERGKRSLHILITVSIPAIFLSLAACWSATPPTAHCTCSPKLRAPLETSTFMLPRKKSRGQDEH